MLTSLGQFSLFWVALGCFCSDCFLFWLTLDQFGFGFGLFWVCLDILWVTLAYFVSAGFNFGSFSVVLGLLDSFWILC